MSSLRESSKLTWKSSSTVEHINAGSFQRIADACELMAENHHDLVRDRDMYKRWYESSRESGDKLRNSNAALRGVITKLRKKLA
jgi:hypothetical protein